MKNLISQYIEISSEEEMEKASKWFESIGYTNDFDKTYVKDKTYLFIKSNNGFHFGNGDEQSFWKPFSILYDEGMPRDVVRDEEDLLSEAKRLYPIGTKYKCAVGGYEIHTVESMDWAPSPLGHIYGEYSKGCIYKHGKWAEIVHEVKPIEKKEEPKFEVGKWYKPTQNSNAYRRCSKVVDYRAGFEYNYFISGIGSIARPEVGTTNWIDVHLVTMEEIQVYLPKGHPDLIVKSIEEWSVGSYVVFLTDEVKTNSGAEITKGKPYKINKKQYDLLYSKSDTKKDFNFFWEKEECRWFATLEEAEAFSKSLISVSELQPKDIVPEYVKYTNSNGWFNKGEYEIGKIYKWFDLTSGVVGKYSLNKDWSKWTREFEISTKETYDAQQLICVNREEYIDTTFGIKPFAAMSKDELLEYTKKKYPIGCKVKFPGYESKTVSQELFWQYKDMISHSGCCPVFDIKDGKYIWAEIIEMPEAEPYNRGNIGSNISLITYSYTGPTDPQKETHQSINKTGKQFSPIKVELIKVKQLKIN